MECLGGNLIYPKPGYWRIDNYSENFIQCRAPNSCNGGNETDLTGHCNEGYTGNVCGVCEPGWGKFGNELKCAKCRGD